ncbi:MAG: chlorite dismutase family protein [Halobacteria archaeon]
MADPDAPQFLHFSFYRTDPAWRRQPAKEREAGKREFIAAVEEWAPRVKSLPYSTTGLRAETDLLLWRFAASLDDLQAHAAALQRTGLGRWLEMRYGFLAMARPSPYVADHRHSGQEGTMSRVEPAGRKYLFVYPFVKTHDWYQLPPAERMRMMKEHIAMGHKHPSVKNNTSYSFGLDDHEFMVAFETESPADFLALVEGMRTLETRKYTLRDTPIISCIRKPLKECLEDLG